MSTKSLSATVLVLSLATSVALGAESKKKPKPPKHTTTTPTPTTESSSASASAMRPLFRVSTEIMSRFAASGGPQHNAAPIGGYSPAQIRTAYGIDRFSGDGQGQTIAVIDAYGNPTMEADLNTFSQQYGLPQTGEFNFRVIGATSSSSTSNSEVNGWMVETSLDVEWAHSVAPKANIVLVVASSASNAALMTAVDDAVKAGANVISMSFGGPESKSGSTETRSDQNFNVSGVTFVASSGDDGAGVIYPASSPYVVAVGGTTLPLDSSGNLSGTETAWSGSGGGISAVERAPSYQAGEPALSSGMRGVPDVSYDADPKTGFSIYFSNPFNVTSGKKKGTVSGWFEVGGTSAGSPQWAGLIALANSQRNSPLPTLEALYKLANSSSSYFRDITSGCDGKAASDCAAPGYDTVTGLGSPMAASLLPALASY